MRELWHTLFGFPCLCGKRVRLHLHHYTAWDKKVYWRPYFSCSSCGVLHEQGAPSTSSAQGVSSGHAH